MNILTACLAQGLLHFLSASRGSHIIDSPDCLWLVFMVTVATIVLEWVIQVLTRGSHIHPGLCVCVCEIHLQSRQQPSGGWEMDWNVLFAKRKLQMMMIFSLKQTKREEGEEWEREREAVFVCPTELVRTTDVHAFVHICKSVCVFECVYVLSSSLPWDSD